jgi:O-antigen/teichoic acid export membrane protein
MTNQTATDTTNDLDEALLERDLSAEEITEIKKKSVKGVLSFFIRTAILQGIGFLSALLLSVFLTPEDFGIYGIVTQLISLLIFFSDVGLAASLIQKKKEPSKDDYRTAFTVQLFLAFFIFAVALLIGRFGSIHDKIGAHGVWVLLALAISFPLATFKTIPSIILERKLDFNKLVLPQIFEQIVFNLILIVLAWKGFGVLSYAYAIVARSVIGLLVMQIIQPWKPQLGINKDSLKSLLGFGVKFQINDLLARIKDQLYFLVLGAYFPLKEFGYIQWAKNWSMYPYNLTVQNVMSITFPTFSRLQGHKDLLKKAIEKSVYFISALIFPILVGMSVFIYPLTVVFVGYQKWQPAIFSFIFFALSVAWSAISTPLTNTLNAIGKINQTLKLMVFWTLITWILTPIMIWKFNFNGVALSAFLISFTSVLSVIMVKKYVKIEIWKNVWAQLLASALMAVFAYLGMGHWVRSYKNLFIGILLTAAIYAFSFIIFSGKKLLAELKSLRKNI